MSPKSLARIIRFQTVYQSWTQQLSPTLLSNEWSAYYYDQSHFIKEFKSFTGFRPSNTQPLPMNLAGLSLLNNDSLFYKTSPPLLSKLKTRLSYTSEERDKGT